MLTQISIIAVQGLASTYEWTWTKQLSDGSSVMWLRDLLPQDLPDARIMTFEYDSKWLRDAAKVTLEDCGNRLLEAVIWDRTHWKSQQICPIMVLSLSLSPVLFSFAFAANFANLISQGETAAHSYRPQLRWLGDKTGMNGMLALEICLFFNRHSSRRQVFTKRPPVCRLSGLHHGCCGDHVSGNSP